MITSQQASELLGISKHTFLRKVQEGEVPIAVDGADKRGTLLFLEDDILKYKEDRQVPPISISHIPDDFGYWFAGLVDGEGSFSAVVGQRPKTMPQPQFAITLRADDGNLITYIQEVLGFGSLYDRGEYTNPQGYTSAPGITYLVNSKRDTEAIVALFQKYSLRSKKAKDFVLWSEIVEIRNSREWRGRVTPEKLKHMEAASGIYKKLQEVKLYTE